VTNHVPPERAGAFRELHERVGLQVALFGGRSHHATASVEDPGVPHQHVQQGDVLRLASSGRFRAVICGTAGRTALPAAWAGARRARVPFVLWTALWSHPRTPAFLAAGAPLLHALYRHAAAVVTYGPHVSAFVRRHGARNVHEAPQAVDEGFWAAEATEPRHPAPFTAVHAGRAARYKGVPELLDAWQRTGLHEPGAALVLIGEIGDALPAGVRAVGHQPPDEVRNFFAGASVLVMPAIATPEFREPWGLVANEAMHQRLPVIATDAVGAAAGGLVRHERNGLVVPAGDAAALAEALRRLHDDPGLAERLGAAAGRDVSRYTFSAWADGMTRALASVGATERGDR
jgi:glycosyltransferase involved in cell wall biosynthesis